METTKILDMLDWGMPRETQEKGIALAKESGAIVPFIQPLTKKHNKNVWDNCAAVIAAKSDRELEAHLIGLLEWLQDMNWPGAFCILERLQKYADSAPLRTAADICIRNARNHNDSLWEDNIQMVFAQWKNCTKQRTVIAELLYRMALYEKTQKAYILLPRKRKMLKSRLTMFYSLVEILHSVSPLSPAQHKQIQRYIESHQECFPEPGAALLTEPCTDETAPEYILQWKQGWTECIVRMEELLRIAGKLLEPGACLTNKQWILCFMAFHNLPRVFFPNSLGIWNEPLIPLDVDSALRASQPHFEI